MRRWSVPSPARSNAVTIARSLRHGYEALRAMGERGYVFAVGELLAEALYAQGHFQSAALASRRA